MTSTEIDLHGMTWAEAKPAFTEFYNHAIRQGPLPGPQITVIHGHGSTGVGGGKQGLGNRLRRYLEPFSGQLEWHAGEHVDGNQGITLVSPTTRAPLPVATDELEDAIGDYCVNPQTQSKISNKVRRRGDPAIMAAVRSLLKQGALTRGVTKRETTFHATGTDRI